MTAIHARQALLSNGWADNVRIEIRQGGIAAIESDVAAAPDDERHDCLLPGMPNLHSHAFQRGMAGLAENRGPGQDSFWSWREAMYRFALAMTPDEVEAVASQLYVEMLEAGFTRVGEFHYLHHDRDGSPYADLAEMGGRIAAAAAETGIRLTLLPVFYAHAGFGAQAPEAGQRRFVSNPDGYARLLEASRKHVARLDGGVVGIAPHSLRAVTPEELARLVTLDRTCPIHIHIAEQVKEVVDCEIWSGQRPVDWLLSHQPPDARWCLIHATQMTQEETVRLASTGAVAGLCPITEANLGDGIFNGPAFLAAGGAFGVGSDSNVLVGVADELRQLDYSQRLRDRARNLMTDPVAGGSTGRFLFEHAQAGGAQALGGAEAGIRLGAPADFLSLFTDHPALTGYAGDHLLDAWIFAGQNVVDCVWTGGIKQVEGGRHHRREAVVQRFRKAMARLRAL
jgi:formiminoglutamate deiminase